MSTQIFYITKYALSAGIVKVYGEIVDTSVRVHWCEGWGGDRVYFYRDEWHTTIEAAQAQAGVMRAAKVKSLRKQLAKLEATSAAKIEDRTHLASDS